MAKGQSDEKATKYLASRHEVRKLIDYATGDLYDNLSFPFSSKRTSCRSGPWVIPKLPLPRKRTVTGAFGGSHAELMVCRRLLANLVAARNESPSCIVNAQGRGLIV